jgi:hypothetical protein
MKQKHVSCPNFSYCCSHSIKKKRMSCLLLLKRSCINSCRRTRITLDTTYHPLWLSLCVYVYLASLSLTNKTLFPLMFTRRLYLMLYTVRALSEFYYLNAGSSVFAWLHCSHPWRSWEDFLRTSNWSTTSLANYSVLLDEITSTHTLNIMVPVQSMSLC